MKLRNVEDIYPLSPMQQLMLAQSLSEAQSGLLFEQLLCTLWGTLKPEALQRAWQQIIERHAMLRTAFLWEGLEQPLQVVRMQVKLPWAYHDWRGQPPEQQQSQLELLLETDRTRSFNLMQAPLMRITLIQVADNVCWFLWSRHHILLDGWSGSLLLNEVFQLYDRLCSRQPTHLPLPRPFRDYIAWLQHQDQTEAESFWRQRLQGFRIPTSIGVEIPPEVAADVPLGYAEEQYVVSAETTATLGTLARQQQLTLSTLIQGAWALLLHLYSGEHDVVFGGTVSGRPSTLEGVETMIGQFINNLPIRVQVSPDSLLLPWLRTIQENELHSRQYEHIPLPQIQAWSDVAQGMRLFESIVIVNYVDDDALHGISNNLEVRDLRPLTWTGFPLTLLIVLGNPIVLRLKYDCRRFQAADIQQMGKHFARLLEQMIANFQQRLADISLLTEAEQHNLLAGWNSHHLEYNQQHCLHHIVESQAARTPGALAVLAGKQSLTYHDLNQRANQLAHALQAQGITPGTSVALYMDHALELPIGLLGILKAGAAVLPLDPHMPPQRIATLLTVAKSSVLLTRKELTENLSGLPIHVLCLDSDNGVCAGESSGNLVSEVAANCLAYQLPVSLPTGNPGLVALEHCALTHLALAQRMTFSLQPDSRILLASPLSLESAIFEVCLAWSAGAALCLDTQTSWLQDAEVQHLIQQYALTHLTLPVSALDGLSADTLADMHLILLSDAPVSAGAKATLSAAADCYIIYGAAETTSWATAAQWDAHHTARSIGRAVGNTTVYVLDRKLCPVSVGVPGEIYVGGDGLASGYVDQPALDGERFIPHPFRNEPGARLYRTGDRGRYLPDGTLEVLGRNDRKLRVRGFRVEPAEIERILEQHSAVAQAVVVAGEQVAGNQQLTAYIVARNGQHPRDEELRNILRQKLPAVMLPASFLVLECLPLLPDGTVDYRALPAARVSRPDLATDYVAPESEVEEVLAEIWQELLGIRQVGIHDNFFALGGNSLRATQVVSRLREAFPLEVPLHMLFEQPTISQLSQKIEDMLLEKLASLSEEEVQRLM